MCPSDQPQIYMLMDKLNEYFLSSCPSLPPNNNKQTKTQDSSSFMLPFHQASLNHVAAAICPITATRSRQPHVKALSRYLYRSATATAPAMAAAA